MAQARLGGTIYATLGVKNAHECSICFSGMKAGDRVCQLVCHETHEFHEDCYNNFINHNAAHSNLKLCPLCRVPIDEEAVIKKIYHKGKPSEMNAEDAFALGPVTSKVEDNVANEN